MGMELFQCIERPEFEAERTNAQVEVIFGGKGNPRRQLSTAIYNLDRQDAFKETNTETTRTVAPKPNCPDGKGNGVENILPDPVYFCKAGAGKPRKGPYTLPELPDNAKGKKITPPGHEGP